MSGLILGLAVIAVIAWLGHIVVIALRDALKASAARAGQAAVRLEHERFSHEGQIADMVRSAADERREAAQERSVLLNRIQDPPAGVAASLAYLPSPEPGAYDLPPDR